MSSVWLCIPSKRPPEEVEPVLKQWRERGYKIALYVDSPDHAKAVDHLCDAGSWPEGFGYPGYARAVNFLVGEVLANWDLDAEWFVIGGDDVLPDPNRTAEEIARECREHFAAYAFGQKTAIGETFGVMQPTGHRWGDKDGAYIDRVCGSAWIGREFARRVNKGQGPLWPEFYHMFVDECLQEVAIKLGVLWQRPDLTHFHQHWALPREGEKMVHSSRMPEFLKRANSPEEWNKGKAILERLRAQDFEPCMPL